MGNIIMPRISMTALVVLALAAAAIAAPTVEVDTVVPETTFAAEEFTTTEGSFDVNDSASVEEDDVAPETSFEVDLYDTTGSFEMPMEDDLVEMLPKLSGSFAKHLPEMGLVQEEVNAGKKVCKMAHGMADHNCVVHDLFSSSKVGCKTVAKAPKKKAKKVGCKNKILKYACPKSCKSGKRSMYYKDQSKLLKSKFKMGGKKIKILFYACPESCKSKVPAKAYGINQDKQFKKKFGKSCSSFVKAAMKAGDKKPCLHQPIVNLMCPKSCAGAPGTLCKEAHGKKDHNCVVKKLFNSPKVTCKTVAKKKMCKGKKNRILLYACPESCKSKVPAKAYSQDQDAVFKKKWKMGCMKFIKAAVKKFPGKNPCIHQPILNLMCPKSCLVDDIIKDVKKLAKAK